ncbi:hypothetical protein [Streptomyces sp. NPDC003952]
MTAFSAPTVGDKVRNIYTGREFQVIGLELVDFGQGDGPELSARVKGDRGDDDVWSGKVTAFAPVTEECVAPHYAPGDILIFTRDGIRIAVIDPATSYVGTVDGMGYGAPATEAGH